MWPEPASQTRDSRNLVQVSLGISIVTTIDQQHWPTLILVKQVACSGSDGIKFSGFLSFPARASEATAHENTKRRRQNSDARNRRRRRAVVILQGPVGKGYASDFLLLLTDWQADIPEHTSRQRTEKWSINISISLLYSLQT